MGVPVVTFNARGNNDVIKNMYNGLLLDVHQYNKAEEIKEIIEAICWLRNNPEEAEKLKQNALKDRSSYSRESFVNEQLNYYRLFDNQLQAEKQTK